MSTLEKFRWAMLSDIARGNKTLSCSYSLTRTGWGGGPRMVIVSR
ncbi:hypothetical protein HMPREF9622_00467 [Cutibacterium modestum HL037PA3]|uniref:Uncharacterized protein n=1 Tax=Cutibacterium modestum HL044PA1 TaxID=765109 RepID=A0ABP2K817_9ACTN|nr:hypothetical protein HMPREF9607_00691 [Cutibacterium modestum HL044PA1]EFT16476.1 hypothetical protein HMPREF9622_00467 [Cutibacterium modestum HL037PA3]